MPSYSSLEVVRTLERIGFKKVSQRGSHLKLRMKSPDMTRTVIVKMGAKDVPPGTMASILRQAGLSREEFQSAV